MKTHVRRLFVSRFFSQFWLIGNINWYSGEHLQERFLMSWAERATNKNVLYRTRNIHIDKNLIEEFLFFGHCFSSIIKIKMFSWLRPP